MDYYNEFLQSNIAQWYLLNTKYQSVAGVACARKILGNYGRFPASRSDPNQQVNTVIAVITLREEFDFF